MKVVNQPVMKKDAMALVTGKPVFTDDKAPKDCLIVKLLRSPYANAMIKSINTQFAMKVPGIEAIYTWEDVPQERFTMAGQTYPELSPYDRQILDQHVRYVGDPVAIVAGENEKCVDQAIKMLRVEYDVLPANLDPRKAMDEGTPLVHPEDNWKALCNIGADNKKNLCATEETHEGDVDAVLEDCDVVVEHTYHTKANQQAMMETFRTYCFIDEYGRLNVVSSTQIVFHVRRILANALCIPKSKIRVSKPRIGGGFGANRDLEAHRFAYDVVYTNRMSAGAYRGYGATQGIFALESAVSELAAKIGMDPTKIREMNMVREGDVMPAYYGETANSCALDRCLARAKEMLKWDEKYPCKDMGNGKVRSVGVSMAMQGSGISGVDVGSATIKLNDDGLYTLSIAAADMGTGCDTILAQMAAECLECSIDDIMVSGADTDTSPYDSGSYASSSTYVTGKAVERACEKLKGRILNKAAQMMEIDSADNLEFDGKKVSDPESGKEISLVDISTASMVNNNETFQVTETNSSPVSPPPFMVGMVEIELDKETGHIEILDYVAVVDCGTPVNPNLARVQVEGGLGQGIGMALYEGVDYTLNGYVKQNSFMQYKVPSRVDVGKLRVEFESSYEPTGPFGAKSIGEIVINTPSPAIADAVFNATGLWIRELPITSEKIAMGLMEQK